MLERRWKNERLANSRAADGWRGNGQYIAAKNAALPIMAASILTDETTLLEACPRLSDIGYMGDILKTLGCGVRRLDGGLEIDPQGLNCHEMPVPWPRKSARPFFAGADSGALSQGYGYLSRRLRDWNASHRPAFGRA